MGVGVALAFITLLASPGGLLVDSAGWDDIAAITDAVDANGALAHFTSLLYALAMLILLAGIIIVWNFVEPDNPSGMSVRAAMLLAAVGIVMQLAAEGLDLATVKVLQDGVGDSAAPIDQIAQTLQSARLGLLLIAFPLVYLGVAIGGVGILRLLPPGCTCKKVSILAAVLAVAALVLYVVRVPDTDVWRAATAILSIAMPIWLIMVAHSLYTGRMTPNPQMQEAG